MRTFLIAAIGLGLMAALCRADEPCAACESCPSKGRCAWTTEAKKSKEVIYAEKRSEFCPATISANCPCWASFLHALGCDTGSPRTKSQLVKKYEEKETQVKKLKPAVPCDP